MLLCLWCLSLHCIHRLLHSRLEVDVALFYDTPVLRSVITSASVCDIIVINDRRSCRARNGNATEWLYEQTICEVRGVATSHPFELSASIRPEA